MGACECENPIEFGYELNSSEKDKDTDNNDKEKKEYFSKLNYVITIQAVSPEREKITAKTEQAMMP